MSRSRIVRLWLPVAVWAALIFALSSIPSLDSGLGTWDFVLRKIAHVLEYCVLGLLLARALDGRVAAAFALAVAYAASDELHQHFVTGRHGTLRDVAIDALGIAAGVAIYVRVRRPRPPVAA